jgi:hypothetical protein
MRLIFALVLCLTASLVTADDNHVRVIGRADFNTDSAIWSATWPGVTWEGKFAGTAIGVTLTDSANYFNFYIDGKVVQTIAPANGERTVWIKELPNKEHQFQLVKRTESLYLATIIKEFILDKDGKWLTKPDAPHRQIEFIGDSWTAGFGILKNSRECAQEEIQGYSDVSQTFGMSVAKHYNADWQINAMSGMGMVRNWGGNLAGQSLRTYYSSKLQTDLSSTYKDPTWQPQVIWIGLGTNDFSVKVKEGEAWTQKSLAKDYVDSYIKFVEDLRKLHPDAHIVLVAEFLWPDDLLRPLVKQVVDSLNTKKDKKVHYYEWQNLQLTSCMWHPSISENQNMAQQAIKMIDSIHVAWDK